MSHRRYWNEVNGLMSMPRKMAGNAMSTMVASIEAINIPRVVLESATHLY